MSPSSTGDSPRSTAAAAHRPIPHFSPSAALDFASPSPSPLKSPISSSKPHRAPTFGRIAAGPGGMGPGTGPGTAKGKMMAHQTPESESRPDSDANGAAHKASSDEGSNPLKRRNTDATIDYPRRRATIACEVCRSRKSRCDGTKPKCRLCTELGAECVYREPGVKLDAGDKLILDRLARIENLLQMNLASNSSGSGSGSGDSNSNSNCNSNSNSSNNSSNNRNHNGHSSNTNNGGRGGNGSSYSNSVISPSAPSTIFGAATLASITQSTRSPSVPHGTANIKHLAIDQTIHAPIVTIPNGGLGTWASGPSGTNISTMPRVHTNATLHLLHWPIMRDLVSRPYDPQILLQLEIEREPLHTLTKTPSVDLSNTPTYIDAYFERVNVWYACVNPYTWKSHYRTALTNGFREGPESCVVLLVLALGQASLRGSISRIVPREDPPGLQYFNAAWSLLPGMMTSPSVLAAQCHLLAAAYLFYLVRPLEAWNLLCSTSTKLQLLLMTPNRIPPEQRELTERVYWNALLFESDLLAELDLPHSGVVQFEENVGLPGGFEGDEHECVGRDELWYFLAEIALRRLLNRVSQLIYSKDSMAATGSLGPVVSELDFQLTQWYENLPPSLQFPFTRAAPQDPVQTVLRLRFYACRTIIYRPYILAVMDNEQAGLDPVVRDGCLRCLEAAIRQLEYMQSHHCGHMPYLWQGALSIVSQTLLVMGATMSPSLYSLLLTIVPQRELIDHIINEVVLETERYAPLAPSLGLAAEIIREAEVRRRAFIGG